MPDNYIVFIGRLGAVKNIYMLLDAYEKARLNECYLVIVGDGDDDKRNPFSVFCEGFL